MGFTSQLDMNSGSKLKRSAHLLIIAHSRPDTTNGAVSRSKTMLPLIPVQLNRQTGKRKRNGTGMENLEMHSAPIKSNPVPVPSCPIYAYLGTPKTLQRR